MRSAGRCSYLCVIDPALHGPILLDPLKTEQVLGNLVSNAIKFTEQGKVVVEATTMTEGGRDWLKRVIDTGIGIAIEDQQRLFAPFVQAEQSDSRRFGGTGLGLSICNRLVELMNGSIRLVSEPGLGSCFDVRIPMEPVTVAQPADVVQTGLLNDLYIASGLSGLTVGLCSPHARPTTGSSTCCSTMARWWSGSIPRSRPPRPWTWWSASTWISMPVPMPTS
jgi:two-component system capsular synthesis sensor histidine kinase RcsC